MYALTFDVAPLVELFLWPGSLSRPGQSAVHDVGVAVGANHNNNSPTRVYGTVRSVWPASQAPS